MWDVDPDQLALYPQLYHTCSSYLASLFPFVCVCVIYVCIWASLAQLVKNPPTMQETLVQFLGQEVLLEKGMATYSSILACRVS